MNYGLISKYRKELMGLATLWIVLLHGTAWFSSFLMGEIKASGYCGVDGFLFLSAVGLYFSWQNHSNDIRSFYCRRFIRIMPAYLIIVAIRCVMENTGKRYFVLLSTTLSFWILDDLSMWFIAGIVILYILSPLFLKTLESEKRTVWYTCFFLLAFLSGLIMRETPQNLFFVRIPSFLLGFLFAKRIYEKQPLKSYEYGLFFVLFILGITLLVCSHIGIFDFSILFSWATRWYSALLFEVPLMLYISAGLDFMSTHHMKVLLKLASFIGEVSLETYLWYEVLLRFFRESKLARLPFEYHGVVYSLIILAMAIVLAYAVHLLVKKWIMEKLSGI